MNSLQTGNKRETVPFGSFHPVDSHRVAGRSTGDMRADSGGARYDGPGPSPAGRHLLYIVLCGLGSLLCGSASAAHAAKNRGDAYIFNEIDHQQSLSHSSVICIYKDSDELMWFGTYDGVNCFDGQNMEVFRADFSKAQTLDNNVIFGIDRADGNCLWITTQSGVNRFSRDNRRVEANYAFASEFHLCSNANGNTWLVSADSVAYYNTRLQRFVGVSDLGFRVSDPGAQSFITGSGELWLFPDSAQTGDVCRLSVDSFDRKSPDGGVSFSTAHFHHRAVESLFCQDDKTFCFIDSNKDLYIYDVWRQTKVYIRNLSPLLGKYGPVVGICPFYDDLMIAFRTNGLMRLKATESYREEIIDRNLRIFCLYKDSDQGVLWIGVDGKGAMMYMKRHSIATNLLTAHLSQNFTRQVRSILTDADGSLWFGTKGDGLVRILNYGEDMGPDKAEVFFPDKRQSVRIYTRDDTEFAVYSLQESRFMDGFWVGSGPAGLYYYLHGESSLRHLDLPAGSRLEEVHKVYEADDSTLYAATRDGFYRLRLERNNDGISARSLRRFRFFHEQQELSTFFSMIVEGDSILWLGSRDRGLVRFDLSTDDYWIHSLRELTGRPVDDVLCMRWARNGDLLVGTSAGLVRMRFNGKKIETFYAGREQGLINDMIHGILEDEDGFLWLSTNKGLIKFNPGDGSSHSFYYSGGVQIGEFSDDAYYECPYTGRLFFGGMDGLLYLEKGGSEAPGYYPDILLRKLRFGSRNVNLSDYYDPASGVRFKSPARDFTLSFAVPDYVSGSDIEYSWKLEGYDREWSPFGAQHEATYSDIPVGEYVFHVRYRKDIFDSRAKSLSVPLRILPLWYQTALVRSLIVMLVIAAVLVFVYLLRGSIRHKRVINELLRIESGNASSKKALCDNREVVSGLTSIYRACAVPQAGAGMPSAPNADAIKEAVLSLLLPAGELHPGALKNSPPRVYSVVGNVRIRELSDEALRLTVRQGAEAGNIEVDIPEAFTFPVYKHAFRLFFNYIYLFAAGPRRFAVSVSESEGMMTVSFRSSRTLLKSLQEHLSEDPAPSPEAGESEDSLPVFLHRLVRVMMVQLNPVVAYSDIDSVLSLSFLPAKAGPEKPVIDRKIVLLLEDHDEMYWLLDDILSDEYVVYQVRSIQQAVEFMETSQPAVFLVDLMIYSESEEAFMEFVNSNGSLLAKVAFVLMFPWRGFSFVRRELILRADAFAVMPYDIAFLPEIVHHAVYGRAGVKQMRVDGLSEQVAGMISCTTSEQVEFIRKMVAIIEENIDRENLGSSFIADRLAMSSRQFYRKFKEISDYSPAEFIKNYRLEKAAVLLLGNMPIKEVIVEIGITSRSYFYREFTARYGMTPSDYRNLHNGRTE